MDPPRRTGWRAGLPRGCRGDGVVPPAGVPRKNGGAWSGCSPGLPPTRAPGGTFDRFARTWAHFHQDNVFSKVWPVFGYIRTNVCK